MEEGCRPGEGWEVSPGEGVGVVCCGRSVGAGVGGTIGVVGVDQAVTRLTALSLASDVCDVVVAKAGALRIVDVVAGAEVERQSLCASQRHG